MHLLLFTVSAFEVFLHVFFHAKTRVKRRLPILEEHWEWANASYYHSSEGTVNSNEISIRNAALFPDSVCLSKEAVL